ncbi:MAG: citrate synthase, partial [candidate division Zixibacteria bacterium]|nr:citrate synthase [candidate division Zixibacteria bacterium]
LPTKTQLEEFDQRLKAHRTLPAEVIELIKKFPTNAHPMEALRTVVSALGMFDRQTSDLAHAANVERSIKLTSLFATSVAAFERHRAGKEVVPPDGTLSHAANFLYMFRGEKPEALDSKAMDISLILHADHEMNASTLSCRVVISSLTDYYSAVTAGVGSLKGPLHGGANEAVMRTLEEIGTLENTKKWMKDALSSKVKVPGFGHRVYKYYDPRASILRSFAEQYAKVNSSVQEKLEMARIIEKMIIDSLGESKGIYPNVDFYSGIIYTAMGFSKDTFTPIFAVARIAGWCAQLLEQLADNRIYRPRCRYTGNLSGKYIPLAKR